MNSILTSANVYTEPGLKLIISASADEIGSLTNKIQQSTDFELPNIVAADDGNSFVCKFLFSKNEEKESFVVGDSNIDLTFSLKTSVRLVELLTRLKRHPNNAFQFIDLESTENQMFSVIIQMEAPLDNNTEPATNK